MTIMPEIIDPTGGGLGIEGPYSVLGHGNDGAPMAETRTSLGGFIRGFVSQITSGLRDAFNSVADALGIDLSALTMRPGSEDRGVGRTLQARLDT